MSIWPQFLAETQKYFWWWGIDPTQSLREASLGQAVCQPNPLEAKQYGVKGCQPTGSKVFLSLNRGILLLFILSLVFLIEFAL